MKRNRIAKYLLIVVVAAVCATADYCITYPMKLNLVTLDSQINSFLTHGKGPDHDVKFLGTGVEIDDLSFYLIRVDKQFGYVKLKNGPLGRSRIEHVGYGTSEFRSGIIESRGKKYLLLGGTDYGGYITDVRVELQGDIYELSLGERQEHKPFLAVCEVEPDVSEAIPDVANITFFDRDGKDITANYNRSSSVFH